MDTQVYDYFEIAKGRVTSQFKGAVNIEKLLKLWSSGFQELQEVFIKISAINDVDTARDYELEVIGNIVGQPRELINVSNSGHFGFLEDPGAKTFGSVYDDDGGIYYSLYDPDSGNVKLADLNYRAFVKAKILLNNAGSTPEDIIEATKYLFQTETVELVEGSSNPDEPACFSLYIGRPWNDPEATFFPGLDEAAIADRLLPKPAGVRIEYVNESVKDAQDTADDWWFTASLTLYNTAHVVMPEYLSAE